MSEEEQIWSRVTAYIAAHLSADHQTILDIHHSRSLTWPSRVDRVIGREDAPEYLATFYPAPSGRSFRIERLGLRIVGSTAVNHFRLHSWAGSESEREGYRTARLSQVWTRDGGQWYFLGGSDAAEPPPTD